MQTDSKMPVIYFPFACRLGLGFGGFIYRFRGIFPEISQQIGKYGGKLLMLQEKNPAGSQEVASSILASSTQALS
jgi:hypothetical protein